MLTGVQPWCGRSVEEIYDLVVKKHKKPTIPEGLPPPVENILHGCFEYDFKHRPLMTDILYVFRSSRNAVHGDDGDRTGEHYDFKRIIKWYWLH
ncbi:unnamed protein product [Linum trigynum]|uniref:Serine-threonine/tyrosine-protein kinase catalytic domain-containing protein n=1 Tax=Linum trigynum TaxID=586398 RepID=A0AAV2EQP7_9ROSI